MRMGEYVVSFDELPPQKVYLVSSEVAELLGVSNDDMQRMRREKSGPPYIKVGEPKKGAILYKPSEVEAWRNQQATLK